MHVLYVTEGKENVVVILLAFFLFFLVCRGEDCEAHQCEHYIYYINVPLNGGICL